MIPGHTKFSPDLLFSKVSQTFNRSDVFNTTELAEIAAQYSSVIIDEGDIVMQWREKLSKYSTLPGICAMHDYFLQILKQSFSKGSFFCALRMIQN